MQRYRVALSHAQLTQAASNLLGCALVLKRRVGLIIALASGLMESRPIAKSLCGFFKNRVHGACTHSPIVDVLRCVLCQRLRLLTLGLKNWKWRWAPRRKGLSSR